MPASVNFGRGHRFAAYPRCSADIGECSARKPTRAWTRRAVAVVWTERPRRSASSCLNNWAAGREAVSVWLSSGPQRFCPAAAPCTRAPLRSLSLVFNGPCGAARCSAVQRQASWVLMQMVQVAAAASRLRF